MAHGSSSRSPMSTARINEWLRPMFQRLEREDVSAIVTGTCESFLSDITYVEVKQRDSQEVEFSLVVKSGKDGPGLRHYVQLHELNGTEHTFYVTLVPIFRDLINKKRGDYLGCVDMIPEYFHSHRVKPAEEVLVLQDLTKLDYRLHPRELPMNVDHLKQVLKAYARFHAITFAFRRNSHTGFSAACHSLGHPMDLLDLDTILNEREFFMKLGAICKEERDEPLKTKIEDLARMSENSDVDGPASCIIHGDCDITNYMFKYNSDKTVKHVYFLDWQFARLGPVIYDLSCFLFACMAPSDLHHFDDLKELYFVMFRDVFLRLGFDQQLMFTRDEYERQWLIHARYGLRMMCSVMKNQLATEEEFFDLEELTANARDNEAPPGGVFVMDPFHNGPTKCTYQEALVRRCAERMFPIIKFCMKRRYI